MPTNFPSSGWDTYDKAQLELLAGSDNIKEIIEQNMSISPTDFVDNFLGLMIDGREMDGNANTTNLMQSLDIQPDKELKREALKYIRGNKEHACFKSLTLFFGDLIDAMTDELLTMASMISVSEMSFASRKETDKKNRITNWRGVYKDIPSHGDDNAKFNVSAFLGPVDLFSSSVGIFSTSQTPSVSLFRSLS